MSADEIRELQKKLDAALEPISSPEFEQSLKRVDQVVAALREIANQPTAA